MENAIDKRGCVNQPGRVEFAMWAAATSELSFLGGLVRAEAAVRQ